jgi:ATP-dependent Lon protease
VDGLIESRCMNPIIYIDELDKISKTEHGKELIGILTHLTDPAQNSEFTDKYFSGIPIDLSKCLIIFSYNDPDLIDKILLDRIQRIHIEPLAKKDKLMVARNHIIPEIITNIGLSKEDIEISDQILEYIIDTYTYEAGARKLKEKLYELIRETNLGYFENRFSSLPIVIDKELIEEVFENSSKIEPQKIHNKPRVGLINGLYATSTGLGGITIIEAFRFYTNSHLELKLTGMQGDVMKESMNVAKTLALNLIPNYILEELKEDKKQPFGIHIHCPAGATPKDGPSAGTAITLAILSMLCRLPIKNTIGITGEIDLNGNVLPIGGLESKVLGGKDAGVTTILYPAKNSDDFNRVDKKIDLELGDDFKVISISNIYEAIDYCLILPNGKKAIEYFREI